MMLYRESWREVIEPRLQGLSPCAPPPQTTQRLDTDTLVGLRCLTLQSSPRQAAEGRSFKIISVSIIFVFVYIGN